MIDDTPPDVAADSPPTSVGDDVYVDSVGDDVYVDAARHINDPSDLERSSPGVDGWTHSPGMELVNCPLCVYPSSEHGLVACWPQQPIMLNPFNPEVQNYDHIAICDVGGWHFHRRCERCGYSWVTTADEPHISDT